jgi:hypothetical protein
MQFSVSKAHQHLMHPSVLNTLTDLAEYKHIFCSSITFELHLRCDAKTDAPEAILAFIQANTILSALFFRAESFI